MVKVSDILFPMAVFGLALAGAFGFESENLSSGRFAGGPEIKGDTVIYPVAAYKLGRKGSFEEFILNDSLYAGMEFFNPEDTLPRLSARDTIKVPDSLRLTDPFRYKYYVALIDSLTRVEVTDSLKESEKKHRDALDTLLARADSCDWKKIDSIYFADSTIRARIAFGKWYASLDKKARKKYDYEQKVIRKMAEMDSLRKIKDERQALKDSIRENTPRILETFYLPDSMWYKRIVSWTTDSDFHHMEASVPDTSFNHFFNDYAFRRSDVNSTWLGVAGSPVQPYDYSKRKGRSGVDFLTPMEQWTFFPSTLPHYNSKTPYTELAYWGTLLATRSKESDNIHILTTQNILPELNFQLLYDRWGGNGMLENEKVNNRTAVIALNYVGRKYLLHTGYIHNRSARGENGGITDEFWIRDTTVDAREVPIAAKKAASNTYANTYFLEQQLRIPFNFIEKMKAAADSTYSFNPDSLNKDITTAFVGHSSEYANYTRKYFDTGVQPMDHLGVRRFDNKLFIRLQPGASNGIVSKINAGIGDNMESYLEAGVGRHTENSFYIYGGAEGTLGKQSLWDATGKLVMAGTHAGDFSVRADAYRDFFPFRKAKSSPLRLQAGFETSLTDPNYYQERISTFKYSWDNSFDKISETAVRGRIAIPHWNMDATLNYALLANGIYYDDTGNIRQCSGATNILTASVRKDFSIGGFLHLDNRLLAQTSSRQEVVPVPALALNCRYYIQFVAAKDRKTHSRNVLVIQLGANCLYNTEWYTPGFNPSIGTFYNQRDVKYNNGPIVDAFANLQWKRACIFIKYENMGGGSDYFSAAHYINTPKVLKFGLFWPFYTQPEKSNSHSHSGGSPGENGSESSDSSSGSGRTSGFRGGGLGGHMPQMINR